MSKVRTASASWCASSPNVLRNTICSYYEDSSLFPATIPANVCCVQNGFGFGVTTHHLACEPLLAKWLKLLVPKAPIKSRLASLHHGAQMLR